MVALAPGVDEAVLLVKALLLLMMVMKEPTVVVEGTRRVLERLRISSAYSSWAILRDNPHPSESY